MIYRVTVSFAFGIVFEKIFGLGWSTSALVLLISTFLFFYFQKIDEENFGLPARTGKIILGVGLAFAIGSLRMSVVETLPDPSLRQSIGQTISFNARVAEEPDKRDTSTRYTVRPDSAGRSSILLVASRFPEFKYGDKLKVEGKLEQPKNFSGESGVEFDYISYLAKDRIHFMIYQPKIEKVGESGRVLGSLYTIKNIFIKKIGAVVPEPHASLVGGILFGGKQSLGENLLEDFKNAGLIHIVVLSGYNLTIIVAGVLYAASYFGKRKFGFGAAVIILLLFSTMVGLGATVVRASIMALIAILAKYLGRPNDALRALCVAGILMLLWNPLLLTLDPSFQLSFMATLGLILFSPFVEIFIAKSRLRRLVPNKFGFREIVASTLAVQIFLLPLLIKMSGLFSIVSFGTNILVLPLIPTLMLFGFLTGLFGLLPFVGLILSWPFGAIAYFISQTIFSITEFAAALPLATISLGTIPNWLVMIWYAFYAFLFWRLESKR